jgi:hypothetical protein
MEQMKSTTFSAQELRAWLDTHEAELKAAVLAQPLLARSQNDMASGRDFITDYIDKAEISFDHDDYDSQRVITVAGTWVTRWRLGYE